ncbi:MAG: hypothetical protein ACRDT8_13555 [Micromonosporaceae bacterium]
MDVGDESRLVDDWIREIESTINGTPVEGARTEVALGHSEMKTTLLLYEHKIAANPSITFPCDEQGRPA